MSRPGISRENVFQAVNQLQELGKDPTIEQIRQILKTGSNSTIAGYLRDWRALQSRTEPPALTETMPNEMLAMMKALWERLNIQAEEKVSETEAKAQMMVDELHQQLQKYKTNNHRWQQLFLRWQHEKAGLSNDKLALEQVVTSLQREKVMLQAKLDAQAEQIKEKRLRIEELHRLHLQTQTNIEHEREIARDQHLRDQAWEKRYLEAQEELIIISRLSSL